MADITAAQVKELRDATGVSMMDCKKALVEANGDLNAATKLLRERGVAVAAKRAGKSANQGIVAAASTADGNTLAMVEVNCETDFVARNSDFQAFVASVAEKALTTDADLGELMQDVLMDKIAAVGENMKIRHNVRYLLDGLGKVASYIHMGGKVGVLVDVGCGKPETVSAPAFEVLVKDLTLHIAAAAPRYLDAAAVPADVLAAEREIYAKQVEGKPANIVDKIVDGKIRKFYEEVCLTDQGFVKEPKQSITALLEETGKALGDTITIRRFVRYQLGA
jgi:elongation factor Ts